MKKFLIVFLVCVSQNVFSQNEEQILSKTIERINLMNCVSYKSYSSYSAPYDTLAFNSDSCFVKYQLNNSDSIMSSSVLCYYDDTSKISTIRHNNIHIEYSWDNKTVTIDTINPNYIMAPFLVTVKSLLKYALINKDSTDCQITEFKDSLRITFLFKEKLVEFNAKPFIYYKKSEVSKYSLWVDKNFRPYKLRRNMPHQTSIEQISYSFFNYCNDIQEKLVGLYIPEGFIVQNKKGIKITTNEIESQMASNWSLENVDGDTVKLIDFKGKNLLIEFTGVGCGPCHLSVPMLKRIADEFTNKGFEIISVEISSKNKSVLKHYRDMNKINYEFLIADKEIKNNYKILGLPTFVFINKKGVIEKVLIGYSKDKTEIEIMDLINKMK